MGLSNKTNTNKTKQNTTIRKEALVHSVGMDELRRIIKDTEIMAEDDGLSPQPDRVGRQELEIVTSE